MASLFQVFSRVYRNTERLQMEGRNELYRQVREGNREEKRTGGKRHFQFPSGILSLQQNNLLLIIP